MIHRFRRDRTGVPDLAEAGAGTGLGASKGEDMSV